MTTQINNSITGKIFDLIVKQVDCPRDLIVPEADFMLDLGFDSLDVAEFLINMEETFNIQIPDEEAEGIKTVKQALAKVEQVLS
jgi:acyl carrier protein